MWYENVKSKITELKGKIQKYRGLFSRNEMSVRCALIDPFLKLFGWDVENPSEVIPEFSTQAGRPDYALMVDGKIVAFVGAKALGKSEDTLQYISYCVAQGVPYFITTDGDKWEVYDVHKPVVLEQKLITSWSIENDEVSEIIKRAFILLELKDLKADSKQTEYPKVVKKAPHIPLPNAKTDKNYSEVIFSDGKIYPVKSWASILVNVIDWLINSGKLTKSDIPLSVGSKRYILNFKPYHRSGTKFKNPHRIEYFGGLYIEKNYSSNDILKLSTKILQHFGIDPYKVVLR